MDDNVCKDVLPDQQQACLQGPQRQRHQGDAQQGTCEAARRLPSQLLRHQRHRRQRPVCGVVRVQDHASCNPLTPQYDLPSYSKLPFAQPNFIRTSIDVSDIEGTRPQSRQRPQLNATNCIEDIHGTASGTARHCAPYRVPQRAVNADLHDINGEAFKTKRVTDIMSPRYPISAPLAKLGLRADDALPPGATKSSDGTKVTLIYGSVEGSHGGHGFKPTTARSSSSLRTSDVDGAYPGAEAKRRDAFKTRPVNATQDIDGAVPKIRNGTFHFPSGRRTNPLTPDYPPLEKPLVATIPLLKHKAGDDEAYRQQQQSAWEAQQHVHRPSTSHPTNMSAAAHRPPRPASVAAVYGGGGGGGGSSSRGWESGATFGGTDGIKWGGPTSGVDESLLLPSCAPAPPRPHSSIGHGGAGAEGGGASAAASARKPSPLGSPVAQQRPLMAKSGSMGDHKEAIKRRQMMEEVRTDIDAVRALP